MTELVSEVAGSLGVSPAFLTSVLVLMVANMLLFSTYQVTGSFMLGVLASGSLVTASAFLGFIPIWFIFFGIVPLSYFFIGGVFNEQRSYMWVAALIAIMIAIVVGVNLIPAMTESAIAENPELEGSVAGLLVDALPIIFVAVVILGTVAWIGVGSGGRDDSSSSSSVYKNDKSLIARLKRASNELAQYVNNLDAFLRIKTINAVDNGSIPGIKELEGLHLNSKGELWIDSSFDWYLVEKHPEQDTFKVVGLHKEDASKNVVYLLGRDLTSGVPRLAPVPASRYIEASCEDCLKWVANNARRLAA